MPENSVCQVVRGAAIGDVFKLELVELVELGESGGQETFVMVVLCPRDCWVRMAELSYKSYLNCDLHPSTDDNAVEAVCAPLGEIRRFVCISIAQVKDEDMVNAIRRKLQVSK